MFSIIIPLYNKEKSIQRTLKSVINQTYRFFEIIIINDGSTDRSTESVLQVHDERIRLINQKNEGVSSARNRGIEEARFPFIAFLDADDLWETEYLFEQRRLVNDFPHAAMWGCSWCIIKDNVKREVVHGDIPIGFRGEVDNYFGRKVRTNLFCSSSIVIARHAFSTAGYFNNNIQIGEDLDMWFRIIVHFPVVFYNRAMTYYCHDAENRAMTLKRPDLKVCFPWHLSTLNPLTSLNPDFEAYSHSFCAGMLIPYYFGLSEERKLAREVIKNLAFHSIHKKYTCFFKSPYLLGYLFYISYRIKRTFILK